MGNETILENCQSKAPSTSKSHTKDSFQMLFLFVADLFPIKRSHGHYKEEGVGRSTAVFFVRFRSNIRQESYEFRFVLFISGLFNHAVSIAYCEAWNGGMIQRIMNWKGIGRKLSWPNRGKPQNISSQDCCYPGRDSKP
jgi:hypothetical protein